ncbi:MAG: AurF N-oxygenase family protein [Jatrophihabitantaceae bacterium]
MTAVLDVNDREKTAKRLLGSSSRNSYEPAVDLDWDAPDVPGVPHMPLHRVSLYGTALWDQLSDEQQATLSKAEITSVARVGLWFEILLMRMLATHAYDQDPASQHTHYALTEIGDETRHSVMFARYAERNGGIEYRPRPLVHRLGKLFSLLGPTGPSMWAGTLVAEELLDRLQREAMNDESIAALPRMINRIHVIEEARHVRFAREELVREMKRSHWGPKRWSHRVLAAAAAYVIARSLISPKVYESVGIDAKAGRKAALANPHYQDTSGGWARRSSNSSVRSG